jgi:hypothetical protein
MKLKHRHRAPNAAGHGRALPGELSMSASVGEPAGAVDGGRLS